MKYEKFVDLFNELDTPAKIEIFNHYCEINRSDDTIYVFDDDFFNTFFTYPMDAARATFFGRIQNWNDEYIRFDGYGNLESLSEYDVDKDIDCYIADIHRCEDAWKDVDAFSSYYYDDDDL